MKFSKLHLLLLSAISSGAFADPSKNIYLTEDTVSEIASNEIPLPRRVMGFPDVMNIGKMGRLTVRGDKLADSHSVINNNDGYVFFNGMSSGGVSVTTAGYTTINNYGSTDGVLMFQHATGEIDPSQPRPVVTAANSTITNNGYSATLFNGDMYTGSGNAMSVVTAENATITNNDSSYTLFYGTASGGNARLINQDNCAGCYFDFTNSTDAQGKRQQTAGSIEGGGSFLLGSDTLTTGSNNLSTTVSGVISGSGGLVKTGSGVMTLAGQNTYTGSTVVNDGTLALANASTIANSNGITNNATLDIAFSDDAFTNTLKGVGTTTVSGHNVVLSGNYTGFTGLWNITGSATTASSASLNNAAVNINSDGKLTVTDTYFSNPLTGTGTLFANEVNSTDVFSLAESVGSEFSGTLEMNNGVFNFDDNAEIALSHATLKLDASSSTTVNTERTLGGLTLNGGTLKTDFAASDNQAQLTVGNLDATGGGTLAINISDWDIPGSVAMQNESYPSLFDQDDSVAHQVVKATDTVIGAGSQLVLTDSHGIPVAAVNTLDLKDANGTTQAIASYGNAAVVKDGDNAGIWVGYNLTQLDLQADQTLTLTNSQATNNTLGAKITGSGNLNISANGVAILANAANDYTGDTTLSSGTLRLGTDNALGHSASLTMNPNTTLDINSMEQTLGSLNVASGMLTTAEANIQINTDGHLNAGYATGDYNVSVASTGKGGDLNGTELIATTGGNGDFKDNGGYDLGVYHYNLVQDGNNWLLSSGSTPTPPEPSPPEPTPPEPTPPVPVKPVLSSSSLAVASMMTAPLASWNDETDTTLQRITTSRRDSDTGGVWGSYFGGDHKTSSDNGATANQNVNGFSVGVDKRLPLANSSLLGGLAFSHGVTDTDKMDNGSFGDSNDTTVQGYLSWDAHNGVFVDGILTYSTIDSDITAKANDGQNGAGHFDSHAIGASMKTGYHLDAGHKLFVEPYLKTSMLKVNGVSYTLTNGMKVHNGDLKSEQGEIGVESGMDMAIANNQTLRPFVTLAYQKEFADNNSININEVNIDNNVAGSGVKISAGMEYKVQQNSGAYVVVSNTSQNGNTGSESPWSVSTGVVYSW